MMDLTRKVLNAILFNITWLLCVNFGDTVAVITCIIVLAVHFCYISKNRKEIFLLLQVLLLGVVVDSLLIASGVLIADAHTMLAPIWMAALWLLFATTLNHCCAWLQPIAVTHSKNNDKTKPDYMAWLLVAFVGAVAGPLSYWAGTNFSAMSLALPLVNSLLVISLVWALILPLCLRLAQRHNNKINS